MPSFSQGVADYRCGTLLARPDWRIAIVASRFNSAVVSQLVDGALAALQRSGVKQEQLTLVEVPGAFEIAYTAGRLLDSGRYHGLICLGAVIRGETPHFDMVASNVCSAIAQLNLRGRAPVIMGLLTTDTIEQALNRAGIKSGNNGESAAFCLLEMISLDHALRAEV